MLLLCFALHQNIANVERFSSRKAIDVTLYCQRKSTGTNSSVRLENSACIFSKSSRITPAPDKRKNTNIVTITIEMYTENTKFAGLNSFCSLYPKTFSPIRNVIKASFVAVVVVVVTSSELKTFLLFSSNFLPSRHSTTFSYSLSSFRRLFIIIVSLLRLGTAYNEYKMRCGGG